MSKILLVYEDYAELMSAEFPLKKIGFDVIGIGTELGVKDQIVSFNPDLVIACGRGPKVSTLGVGKKLRENARWQGKVVLIFPVGYKPNPEDLIKVRMDMALEAPVEAIRLIQVVASLTNQNEQVLLERFVKSITPSQNSDPGMGYIKNNTTTSSENIHVTGTLDHSNISHDENSETDWAELERQFLNVNSVVPRSSELDSSSSNTEVKKEKGFEKKESQINESNDISKTQNSNKSIQIAEGEKKSEVSQTKKSLNSESSEIAVKSEASPLDLPNLKEKVTKYSKMVKALKVDPHHSNISRGKTRHIQKELVSGWDANELKDQDKLRRDFTKAMFNRKKK